MTAQISIGDQRLTIRRSGVARWFGSSVDVPLAHVVSVAKPDPRDGKRWYKGIRLAGIQIPGLMTSGIYREGGELVWWDVGRGANVIVVTLRNERLARLMVEVDDPEAMTRALDQALAGTRIEPEGTAR